MSAAGAAAPPSDGAAVLIMARAPRPGQTRRAMVELLGAQRAASLQAALLREAGRWAAATAPGRVFVAHDPPDGAVELRDLVGEPVAVFPQTGDGIVRRLADAAGRVFAHGGGPLLVVWPELAMLRPELAEAVLADLAAGCELVLGPVIDGGFYLVAMTRPLERLFATAEGSWRDADAMTLGFAAVQEAGLELGLLRTERGLRRPADVRAALADPCLPEGVRRILGRSD